MIFAVLSLNRRLKQANRVKETVVRILVKTNSQTGITEEIMVIIVKTKIVKDLTVTLDKIPENQLTVGMKTSPSTFKSTVSTLQLCCPCRMRVPLPNLLEITMAFTQGKFSFKLKLNPYVVKLRLGF